MDVLSDVLNAVRIRGAAYFDVNAAAPWVSVSPSTADIGHSVMPRGEHVIPFHVVMRGHAWVRPADRSLPIASLGSGDVIVFPYGQSHVMSSEPEPAELLAVDQRSYRRAAQGKEPFTLVEMGGRGERTELVCGYLSCDTGPFNPLLDALPPMLVSRPSPSETGLTQTLVQAALDETASGRVGSETVLARLGELMFVQALRAHIDTLSESAECWLSGLSNERVGKVLQSIHARPTEDWSLAGLAQIAGSSRSRLAVEFRRYTGESPMRYLARWRMQLATHMLEKSAVSIAQAGQHVGYESEAAFKRAFRRHVGTTPGHWRRVRRATTQSHA